MENENQDIFKMFEQIKSFKEMTGQAENEDNNFQKMMDMMQMMKAFQGVSAKNESNRPPAEASAFVHSTYYDDKIHTPALRSIKSAIPYLDIKYQKPLGLFIKMIELQKLVELYSSDLITSQGGNSGDYKRLMLMAIRPHMDDDKKAKIDTLLKIIEIKEISGVMQKEKNNGN